MTGKQLRQDIIRPLPSQRRFLNAMWAHKYVLFGGAAGPGKSYILRWALVEFHLEQARRGNRDLRTGLFCENYPVLKDRQIARIRREFPPWLGELRQTKDEGHGFYFRPEYGGGQIALRNLDDPAKYASSEFAAIAVDELTKNDRQSFDDLRFRLRWPGVEHSPFLAASNPGSRGHAWVKKLWVDRDFSGDDRMLDAGDFLFIPARAGENPHNPLSYMDTLNSLPEKMRKAMRDGSWDIFAGQVFTEWRRDLHVVEPFAIPASWTRWMGLDYGYVAPYCALWFARSPDRARIYVYREEYQSGLRAAAQARRIKALSGEESIQLVAADPSLWQQREGVAGDSLAGEYGREGVRVVKANNERLAGLGYVHDALHWLELPGSGRIIKPPRLQVFATCRALIRTLPALPHDDLRVEDVDTNAEDHAYDALRYGLAVERRGRSAGVSYFRIERH